MPLDDDDNPFLTPSPSPAPFADKGNANAHANNGDPDAHDHEDDPADAPFDMALFASMFSKKGVSSQTIRKGQKDFEAHGTRAQDAALETSRRVIEDVLAYTRLHTGDWNRGWLFADYWPAALAALAAAPPAFAAALDPALHAADRVVVLEELKGPQNRSVGRTVRGMKPPSPAVGKVWLLPEEALFMLERGSMDLWWPDRTLQELMPGQEIKRTQGARKASKTTAQRGDDKHSGAPADGEPEADREEEDDDDEFADGVPLSLQAAYALLIGVEGERGKITLPKYQVYAHLKRGGYHVQRAPAGETATDAAPSPASAQPKSVWQWLFSLLSRPERGGQVPPFGPLVRPGLYRKYAPIYKQLELIPRFDPREKAADTAAPEDPFKVFFHVWRPSKHPVFSKSDPPPPDLRIAVVDARDTFVPELEQLEALFDSTPYDPADASLSAPGRFYPRLKHGHRNVLISVVDRGLVNFMRFGQAAFADEKLYERFDLPNRGRGGKRGGGRGGKGGRGRGGRGRR
ncbi:hypothetical protein VDGD_07022 [Verticillium dahliae]|nr:hypothetical protein VDGD_07022 [Verticillium dahliae]